MRSNSEGLYGWAVEDPAAAAPAARDAGGEKGRGETDERKSLHLPAVPTAAAPSSGSLAWKSPSGSAMPRFSNFCRNVGRSPVG